MRRSHHIPANRTRNSSAFQPAIPIRILRQILLVIIHHIGNRRENRGVPPRRCSSGRRQRRSLGRPWTSPPTLPQPLESTPGATWRSSDVSRFRVRIVCIFNSLCDNYGAQPVVLWYLSMKPSEAFRVHRVKLREIVTLDRALRPRVFGSAISGDDTDDSELDRALLEAIPV
jgi:hypothetical protein